MLNRTQDKALGTHVPRLRARAVGDPGDITFLFHVVRSHSRTLLTAALIGLALGSMHYLLSQRLYTASARILIDFRRLSAIGENEILINFRVNDSAVESQSTIIESNGLMRAVIDQLKLQTDPEFVGETAWWKTALGWLGLVNDPAALSEEERVQLALELFAKRLSAKRVGASYVLDVQFKSRAAEKAMRIVNAVATTYAADQLNAKQEVADNTNAWYQRRIAELQRQAAEAQSAAVEYRKQHQVMLVDGKFVDEQQVSELAVKIVQARIDRADAEAKFERIQELLRRGGAADGSVGDELRNNVIIALRQKYVDLARRAAENAGKYGENHQAVVRARADLAELQKGIADEFQRIGEGYRSDASIARSREESLNRALEDLSERSAAAQKARVELSQLDSVATNLRSMQDSFLSRFNEATQEQTFPVTEARILHLASLPQKPSSPRAYLSLGGGLGLALGLGFFVALCEQVFSRRARGREQVEAVAGAPCLAYLPRQFAGGASHRGAASAASRMLDLVTESPFGMFAEGLRRVDLALGAGDHGTPAFVVGFVAVGAGEGASTVAANFATLVAQAGSKCMLVDADLRHRTLTTRLAPAARSGLLTAADNLDALPQSITVTETGVHFLAAAGGPEPKHPSELLGGPGMRQVVELSRRAFTHIVLDLAPLSPVVDARTIAPVVDGYVLVVEWNRASLDALGDVLASNPEVVRKLVGFVFNKVDIDAARRIGDFSAIFESDYERSELALPRHRVRPRMGLEDARRAGTRLAVSCGAMVTQVRSALQRRRARAQARRRA